MSEKKKSFILYNDYRKHIGMLSDEDAGRLFKAIYCLVNGEEPPELSPMAQMALSFISEQLERDAKNLGSRDKACADEHGHHAHSRIDICMLCRKV